jgi:lipopolysaccharide/colanic/teichoic acid biosynthesis glycosyltransferase
MNLTYVLDYRFARTPDGVIWTDTAYDQTFWEPYLRVFDQVTILSRVREVSKADSAWLPVNSERVRVEALPHYLGPREFLKRSAQIQACVRKALQLPCAVILRVPSQLAVVAASQLRRLHKPYGVEVVGDASAAFAPGVVKVKGRAFLRQWFTHSQTKICHNAVAVSYVAECLRRRYPSNKKATTLVCSDVRLEQGWMTSEPRAFDRPVRQIITVATLSQTYKGIDVLLRALAECRNYGFAFMLTVVGHGKYQQSLEALCRRLGIAHRVRFVGALPWGPRLIEELDSADLFVLPSRVEAMPRALLEAMARALPAIATRVGAVPELLPPDQIVEPGDVHALAVQLMRACSSPGRLMKMSNHSLSTARRYSWHLLSPQWRRFHGEVARRAASHNPRLNLVFSTAPDAAKPRLVLVTTSAAALWVFFRNQAKFLAEQGFDVCAVSSPGPELQEFERYSGCKAIPLNMERSIVPHRDLLAVVQLARCLRGLRPDILHTHTPKAGILGSVAGFLAHCPVRLHTYHGCRSETLFGPKRILVETVERWTGTLSTRCFAVSSSLKNQLLERNICSENKLQVLGKGGCAGVDLRQFDPASRGDAGKVYRKRLGIADDAFVVVYIGRIARDKGLAVLAEAWQAFMTKLPGATLVLCGPLDPTDPLAEETLNILQSSPSICFQRGLHTDIAEVLAAADLFVLPSFREGLGVAALEASAMQVPVIASDVTGLADVVIHNVTGLLVAPRDPVELAKAMELLATSPMLRLRMGWSGREFVTANFNRKNIFELLQNEYRSVLAKTCNPRGGKGLKRGLDLLLALPILLLSSPGLAMVAILLKLSGGGPVLFRQQRAGLHAVPFTLYKLRTMSDERDAEGELLPDAQRLTRLGRFLRATSIDELPQLWNVLRGEMTLVGPRPLLETYVSRYSSAQSRRHLVRPGLTGWAQVNGRNALTWEEKFEHDVWYVDHQSFALDLRILFMTAATLLHRDDVSAPGSCTMPEFKGTPAASRNATLVF